MKNKEEFVTLSGKTIRVLFSKRLYAIPPRELIDGEE